VGLGLYAARQNAAQIGASIESKLGEGSNLYSGVADLTFKINAFMGVC
jgi:hypothetical protein